MGKFFEDTLSAPVMFFVVLAALLVPQPGKDRELHPAFLPEEFMLLVCLFLSPILVNLFLIHRQKAFFDRYSIASQAAILAALSIFLAYRFRLSRGLPGQPQPCFCSSFSGIRSGTCSGTQSRRMLRFWHRLSRRYRSWLAKAWSSWR